MIRIIARSIIRISLLTLSASAFAQSQGTVPNHAIPLGKGPGVSGFGSVPLGTTGNCLKSNGIGSDPSFQFCDAANSNILKYGAVAGDPTKTAQNTAAFAAAFSATTAAYCPDGLAFYVSSIAIPTNATVISGACTLIAQGTYAANSGVLLSTSNVNKLTIQDVRIVVDNTTYSGFNVRGVELAFPANVKVQNITVTGGFNGIDVGTGSTVHLINNNILNQSNVGVFVNGSTDVIIDSTTVSTTGSHSFLADQVTRLTMNNSQSFNASSGGFWVTRSSAVAVTGNVAANSAIEGFHTNDSTQVAFVGNTYVNYGAGHDVALSVSDDSGTVSSNVTISGNVLVNPAMNGMYLSGMQFSHIIGNTIINPGGSNVAQQKTCIYMDFTGTQFNTIENNRCDDNAGHMDYWVQESQFSGGGGRGIPSNNTFGSNSGTTPTTGFYNLQGANGTAPAAPYNAIVGQMSGKISVLPQAAAGTYNWNWPTTAGTSGQFLTSAGGAGAPMTWNTIGGAWIPFTPTITCGTGTVTSVTPTGAWRAIGKTVFFRMRITIVTNGSCAATVIASLPINTIDVVTISGRENVLTGKQVQGYGGPAVVNLSLYDNLYPGGTGADIYISGTYESI